MYSETSAIAALIEQATDIVIVQANNPDGDSLGSALALEAILGDLGKQPWLYCGIDVPSYLRYMPGWDRVSNELPRQFDLAIIVDSSAVSLLEQTTKHSVLPIIKSKPVIVLDHHDVESTINFAQVVCNKPVVATAELIYELAIGLDWPLSDEARSAIAVGILSDSLGLMTDATSSRSIHIIAELVEAGVKLPQLENMRRNLGRKSPELNSYKGELLQRVQYHADNRVATVVIPWPEIERYSPLYNPSMLVMDDMRMTVGACIAIAFKVYDDGKITGKIRSNYGYPIAHDLAAHFGGGGHIYASGFKIKQAKPIDDVRNELVYKAIELLEAYEAI